MEKEALIAHLRVMDALDACEDYEDWRPTKSGLLRWDRPDLEIVDQVLEFAKAYGTTGDYWIMRHEPGSEEVFAHAHNNWATLVTFLNTHPAALIHLEDTTGEWVYSHPKQGHGVFLRPGTMHKVEPNDSDYNRYTLIVLVKTDA